LLAIRTGHLYPQEYSGTHFLEAESTPGMWNCQMLRKKSPVTPSGIDSSTFRLVAKCLNHYATPGPCPFCYIRLIASWEPSTWHRKLFKQSLCRGHSPGIVWHCLCLSKVQETSMTSPAMQVTMLSEATALCYSTSCYTIGKLLIL
jgi:hypothetical protein